MRFEAAKPLVEIAEALYQLLIDLFQPLDGLLKLGLECARLSCAMTWRLLGDERGFERRTWSPEVRLLHGGDGAGWGQGLLMEIDAGEEGAKLIERVPEPGVGHIE